MAIKETLQKLTKIAEDLETSPDVQKRVANMRIKAENLGLECTAIRGGRGTTTMSIYFPNDKAGFFITVYPDKPTVFEYQGLRFNQDEFIVIAQKISKMEEIVKSL